MILGYILVGLIAGFIAAAASLISGATLWWMLVSYTVAGTLGVLLALMFVLIRSYILDVRQRQERERWPAERDLVNSDW